MTSFSFRQKIINLCQIWLQHRVILKLNMLNNVQWKKLNLPPNHIAPNTSIDEYSMKNGNLAWGFLSADDKLNALKVFPSLLSSLPEELHMGKNTQGLSLPLKRIPRFRKVPLICHITESQGEGPLRQETKSSQAGHYRICWPIWVSDTTLQQICSCTRHQLHHMPITSISADHGQVWPDHWQHSNVWP